MRLNDYRVWMRIGSPDFTGWTRPNAELVMEKALKAAATFSQGVGEPFAVSWLRPLQ